MVTGIGGNNNDPFKYLNGVSNAKNSAKATEVSVNKTIQLTSKNTVGRENLSENIETLTGAARMNSPEAQGLASAKEVTSGKLTSGYYFDKPLDCDEKIFNIRYNAANTPSIASGTNFACENIDYTRTVGNLKNPNGMFADVFA